MALNLYKIRAAKDAAGDFFRAVQKQKSNYQGFWIATPEGRLLAAHQEFKDHKSWTREVLETLEAALQAFGPVAARNVKPVDPLPHRGVGLQPDGNACLSVYFCVLYRGKREAPPMIDSILLTPADLAALAPPAPAPGAEWAVPEAVARKFSRAISASSDTSQMPDPEDVREVELKGVVESVEGRTARVRLRGRWEATRVSKHDERKRPTTSSSKAEGLLTCDVGTKAVTSLLLVFNGTWRNVAPYDQPVASAAVVEWKER